MEMKHNHNINKYNSKLNSENGSLEFAKAAKYKNT